MTFIIIHKYGKDLMCGSKDLDEYQILVLAGKYWCDILLLLLFDDVLWRFFSGKKIQKMRAKPVKNKK